MTDKVDGILEKFNKQITRCADIEIDTIIRKGEPPDAALRLALRTLLIHLERRIEKTTMDKIDFFPMVFPMKMTLDSETSLWDFQLCMTLKNKFGVEDDNKS